MKHQLYIGLDRSDSTIDFCILDSERSVQKQSKISSSPESLKAWIDSLRSTLEDGSSIAICIEQPCQNLIHFFRQFDFLTLYLINPSLLKKYRESWSASRAKDDRRDALALANFIFERHPFIAPWRAPDPSTQKLEILTLKRRQLVDLRTEIGNKLTQALKDTYPQALKLIGRNLHSPLATDFLCKWPTLAALQKARPSTITQFYYAHSSRRPKVVEERLQIIASAVPICIDEIILETMSELIISYTKQLQTLSASIKRFDALIEATVATHQDGPIFTSLPGAGPTFAARLLAFFGTDREAYPDANSIQKLSGVAPITKQSGKMHFVHRRYACNKFWRQTFVEWAGQTALKSLWAKAYYEQQKARGHRHQSILRSLAYKWQRILFRCWKNNEQYSEKRYLQALAQSGSPLIKFIETVKESHPKLCEQFS